MIQSEAAKDHDAMIPTGFQIRAGRELVGMSQTDLASAAGVGLALVVRAEMAVHMPPITRKDSAAIQQALEAAGVEFVQEKGGAGVELRKPGLPRIEKVWHTKSSRLE